MLKIACCAAHPWLREEQRSVPLDILTYKLVKSYLRATPFKRAALKVRNALLFLCLFLFPLLWLLVQRIKSIKIMQQMDVRNDRGTFQLLFFKKL